MKFLSVNKTIPANPPESSDHPLRIILSNYMVAQAFLAAYQMKLFECFSKGRKTLEDIVSDLSISKRGASALLAVVVNANLVKKKGRYYYLTECAKEYLLSNSPYYYGAYVDLFVDHADMRSPDQISKAIRSDRSQVYDGKELFAVHEVNKGQAEKFALSMHQKSLGPALHWCNYVNVSHYQSFLDIGGGLGTHAATVCQKWPNLHGTVFEISQMSQLARDAIKAWGLNHVIKVIRGDMWKDSFPLADVHFYSDIFHDWTPEKCRFLAKKSFSALPPGGMILIHEMLYNNDKCSPTTTVAYNLSMLLWTQGQQFSGIELKQLLQSVGFVSIFHRKTVEDWGIVGGIKPSNTTEIVAAGNKKKVSPIPITRASAVKEVFGFSAISQTIASKSTQRKLASKAKCLQYLSSPMFKGALSELSPLEQQCFFGRPMTRMALRSCVQSSERFGTSR